NGLFCSDITHTLSEDSDAGRGVWASMAWFEGLRFDGNRGGYRRCDASWIVEDGGTVERLPADVAETELQRAAGGFGQGDGGDAGEFAGRFAVCFKDGAGRG